MTRTKASGKHIIVIKLFLFLLLGKPSHANERLWQELDFIRGKEKKAQSKVEKIVSYEQWRGAKKTQYNDIQKEVDNLYAEDQISTSLAAPTRAQEAEKGSVAEILILNEIKEKPFKTPRSRLR